jgi:hypothetical protein
VVRLVAYTGLSFGGMAALRGRRIDFPFRQSAWSPLARRCAGKRADDLAVTSPEGGVPRSGNFQRRNQDSSSNQARSFCPHPPVGGSRSATERSPQNTKRRWSSTARHIWRAVDVLVGRRCRVQDAVLGRCGSSSGGTRRSSRRASVRPCPIRPARNCGRCRSSPAPSAPGRAQWCRRASRCSSSSGTPSPAGRCRSWTLRLVHGRPQVPASLQRPDH